MRYKSLPNMFRLAARRTPGQISPCFHAAGAFLAGVRPVQLGRKA
jgi:hypothetical protein